MGLGALKMYMGLLKEFRYEYQNMLGKIHKTNISLAMQAEALTKDCTPIFLAIPILLISVSPFKQLSTLEIIGFTIFILSIVLKLKTIKN